MTYKRVAVTHIKADFDAVASAWGAYRLHGCEAILIATDMEPNVYEYLNSTQNASMFSSIHKIKNKDIAKIDNLDFVAVTDCKLYKRLGPLAPLTTKTEELAIYDHHISFGKDLNGTDEHIGSAGSCTTIVVQKLLQDEFPITPFEATLYLLGIYEDTGLLTFSSTTPDDLLATARLLELGGDVTVVNDYIKRELSRTQVFILNELLINMASISVGDMDITYSFASIDEYIDELAFLTHRMMEMEGISTIVVLVRMGPRIVLVARSKEPRLDVSRIAGRFGGGGHPAAASANIKDLELHEAVELLKVAVRELVRPVRFAKEIMTSPARTLSVDDTLESARQFTMKHNLNNIPVVKDKAVAGIIYRKDILQGIKHKLEKEKVSSFMQTEFQSVSPDTPFRIAEEIMLSTNQKLVPVVKDKILSGVITRTDLLRLIHEETLRRSPYEEGTKTRLGLSRTRNVTDVLKNKLSKALFEELVKIGGIVAEEHSGGYLVGGYVRDLLMGEPSKDLDIVVEGDAVAIARIYAAGEEGAQIAVHEKYKTATVTLTSGLKFDFASARTEYYTNPGAAPAVEVSSLRNDLARRDFTINAMAVRIDSELGQLVDYFGGQRDILDKKIRVLHSLSIIDDPSRAFRAVRFAARLGFVLGTNTERLIKDAARLKLYQKITPQRLLTELQLILSEKSYQSALQMLKKYDMLNPVVGNLNLSEARLAQFNLLNDLALSGLFGKITIWLPRFVLLFYDSDFKEISAKFALPVSLERKLFGIYYKARYAAKGLKESPAPSKITELLSTLSAEALLFLSMLTAGDSRVKDYLGKYKHIKPILTGNDLKKLGLKASRDMGRVLEELRNGRLDGKLKTREDEERWVLETGIPSL